MKQTPDIFIVGGGPAGLAAAIACRLKGFRIAVADPAHPPVDKACGEGLMPHAMDSWKRLGIELDTVRSFPLRGIRFVAGDQSVDASFRDGAGLGIRRTVLHQALIDRATELGIPLFWRTRVTGIGSDHVLLDQQKISCRYIIGADGQNSNIRRWAGLDRIEKYNRRFGFRRHYRVAPWTDHVEVYWGTDCQIYVTPISHEEVGIALLSRHSHLRLDQALPNFPRICRRLAGAVPTSKERGGLSISRQLNVVAKGSVALVGDASGSVDAITGDGLCLSFQQALVLADALSQERLDWYQRQHRRLLRRPALMSSLLLLVDRFPRLRDRTLNAFAMKPYLFENMLAMHTGDLSPFRFALDAMLPLGWRILRSSYL